MLSPGKQQEVLDLLACTMLSLRDIALIARVCRATVARIGDRGCISYTQGADPLSDERPAEVCGKCLTCGHRVPLPCVVCATTERLCPTPGNEQWGIAFELLPEHEARRRELHPT